ncbi:AfsR/SARP family transcriptional regulator [Streptomyces sp. 8N616]|uniref:AfsR/SARP family transcriptional regulator n=1 Tax=Streptomyces sp. 8N616 TaxID=3457414 RepID=UPI003FD0B845
MGTDGPRIQFNVLGPLEILQAGSALDVGPPKRRALLIRLLLEHDRPVHVDRLCEDIWEGNDSSSGALSTVQAHVSRLRAVLEPERDRRAPATVLVREPPGYALRVPAEARDTVRFEQHVETARRLLSLGHPDQSLPELKKAFALWRGPALADVADLSFAAPEIARLGEALLAARELRLAALMAMGRHDQAAAEAEELIESNPLREAAWLALIRALYLAGRPAEALTRYEKIRALLADDLGLEPGPALRDLQVAILRHDTATLGPGGPGLVSSGHDAAEQQGVRDDAERAVEQDVRDVPQDAPGVRGLELCALPPAVDDLTGRESEIAELERVPDAAAGDPQRGTRTVIISGLGGIGKTSFTVAAAHRLRDRFPDGHCFIDLRGMDERPLDPAEALDRMLRALGIGHRDIPGPLEERASLYRSLLEDRRVLVVLDNAANEAQVRPLLPGGDGSLVLVTSRQLLTGLDAAHRKSLEVLSRPDGIALLARIVGQERVAAEPEATAEVAELCGQLPLALRIVGNRLASRPAWTVRHLARQLRSEQRRMAALTAGDIQVRAAFTLSHRQLDTTGKRLFRRASLVPGPDWSPSLAAAAAGTDPLTAEEVIDKLVEANLIQQAPREGRYRFHDLMRLFARERLTEEETEAERDAAAQEMITWLLRTATTAGRFFDPEAPAQTDPAGPLPEESPGAGHREAEEWLDDEITNVLLAAHQAARAGRHREVIALSDALTWYSDVRLQAQPWHELYGMAAEAARAVGSREDEAVQLNYLGWSLFFCQGRLHEGLDAHTRALALAREIGDRGQEAWALGYIAAVLRRMGRPQEGLEHSRQAIALFQEVEGDGYHVGKRYAQGQLARALAALERFDEALELHREFLAFYEDPPAGLPTSHVVGSQGLGHQRIGESLAALCRWQEAADAYRRAGQCFRAVGEHWQEGRAVFAQAVATHRLGDAATARSQLQDALALFEESGERLEHARALHALAAVDDDLGELGAAKAHRLESLRLCEGLGAGDEARRLRDILREELG